MNYLVLSRGHFVSSDFWLPWSLVFCVRFAYLVSSPAVLIVPWSKELSMLDLVSIGRLGNAVKKVSSGVTHMSLFAD
jgi:hypothetical protein